MTAKHRARPLPPVSEKASMSVGPALVPAQQPKIAATHNLRATPFATETHPRRFDRVPTHAVGVHPEHREYPRATLKLPLRLRSVNNVPEEFPITLVTRDISSTGVYFLCPRPLAMGASLEVEVVLVCKPMGHGNVVLATRAHVQRYEPASMPG